MLHLSNLCPLPPLRQFFYMGVDLPQKKTSIFSPNKFIGDVLLEDKRFFFSMCPLLFFSLPLHLVFRGGGGRMRRRAKAIDCLISSPSLLPVFLYASLEKCLFWPRSKLLFFFSIFSLPCTQNAFSAQLKSEGEKKTGEIWERGGKRRGEEEEAIRILNAILARVFSLPLKCPPGKF